MIGDVFIWIGIILMIVGTLMSALEKKFLVKLHRMGTSDLSGSAMILIGIAIENFGTIKCLLSLAFLAIWAPVITHTFAKAYSSRSKR